MEKTKNLPGNLICLVSKSYAKGIQFLKMHLSIVIFMHLAAASILSFLPPFVQPAEALIQYYTFMGTISRSGIPSVATGSAFSGSFSIDYDAPCTDVLSGFSNYRNALLNYQVSINGINFQTIPTSYDIQVSNSSLDIVDIYGPFNGYAADLGFGFHTSHAFSDQSLVNFENLDKLLLDSNYFYIDIFGSSAYGLEAAGTISSIVDPIPLPPTLALSPVNPVPEPSTIILFISVLSGFVFFSWIRHRIHS